MLQGKKILLGVSGSIAAYKAPELVRQLVKQGAEIKVVLTKSACDFVSPLALATVSKNQVYYSFTSIDNSTWINHVELGLWCDILLIAPASALTISRFANGICDNLLTAVYLSCRAPVMLAPAMDVDMFHHFTTQKNIETLKQNGILIIGPEKGELASGLLGNGRMSMPENIVQGVIDFCASTKKLAGMKALVTAGPTFEALDPVRYIGNHSSGKMGIAIANQLQKHGADVTLVAGPGVMKSLLHSSINFLPVVSADDMFQTCSQHFEASNICVMAAAVADFKPENSSNEKIKKKNKSGLTLHLIPTIDIANALGKKKRKNQVLVGFALETHDQTENAKRKLANKNLDFIVLNSLDENNQVFNSEFNTITIIDREGQTAKFEKKSKQEVACDIVEKILTFVQ
jgi:phosphopantothenoylcysteine decarboxylase/phosphopantothenate--cysteine ligase